MLNKFAQGYSVRKQHTWDLNHTVQLQMHDLKAATLDPPCCRKGVAVPTL